ncbi:phosphoserine phosphatase [Vibrio variabilis]|uniref:Phosphoserine phosphatase n=1 Tax=Vibrio variabilis TaxID=990271 RepID=A0ABR4YE62_9VIBR|nr:HAD-IB family hydrolase [Vibrio variabilis]KHA61210.1 phosphoserine phosphatase [Vibrio variabilis]
MSTMRNLALFDFDGTITSEDTYSKFLFFATPKLRLVIGLSFMWPAIALYRCGVLPASRLRPVLSFLAFWRRDVEEIECLAKRFTQQYLPSVIREIAQTRIDWHLERGDDVFVVSAGVNPYLSIWAEKQGIKLVCSELTRRNGRFTGRYQGGDCSRENKVRLLASRVDVSAYTKVFAYGDTQEDIPMLRIADESYLNWKPFGEVTPDSIKAS